MTATSAGILGRRPFLGAASLRLISSANALAKFTFAWIVIIAIVAILDQLGQAFAKGYFALAAMVGFA
jgi:hypothetical protein